MLDSQPRARISQFVEPDLSRGASLLIADRGRFLVAARPPIDTNGRTLIALTGVGGWVEAGESFGMAVQRESVEETGSDINLIDLHQTMVIRSPSQAESLCLMGEIGPAAIVHCRLGTPPFEPWSDDYTSIAAVAVYAGTLEMRPRAVAPEEHPFFLWLYPEHLIALSDSELPLDYLLEDGVGVEGDLNCDPGRSVVRLTDSIPALLTALGPAAFSFLGGIARLTVPARAE